MFLIGQYDSPFVRRVAIAMRLYGIGFEHRPWSTFGDADKIAPFNPLRFEQFVLIFECSDAFFQFRLQPSMARVASTNSR